MRLEAQERLNHVGATFTGQLSRGLDHAKSCQLSRGLDTREHQRCIVVAQAAAGAPVLVPQDLGLASSLSRRLARLPRRCQPRSSSRRAVQSKGRRCLARYLRFPAGDVPATDNMYHLTLRSSPSWLNLAKTCHRQAWRNMAQSGPRDGGP